MNVLCVIPARGNSKRVPNKNLKMVLGKPLIGYTIEAALKSQLCDKMVVSTDDPKISEVSRGFGIEVIDRPIELAQDASAIDDALRHAVREVDKKGDFSPDIVVMLHANVPIRKDGEIDQVINKLNAIKEASAVATAFVIDQRPEWMKTVDKSTGKVKSFLEPTNLFRKQDLPELILLDGAVAAIRTQVLMETEGSRQAHAFLGSSIYAIIHEQKYATEIDTEEDFGLTEYYLSKHNEI